MKRIFITIIFVFSVINIFANDNFKAQYNYQSNDAKSYIGEILYVIPFPEDWDCVKYYRGFKEYDEFWASCDREFNAYYNYHFDPMNWRDQQLSGTRACWLENKYFYVQNVYLMDDCNYTWIFELININDKNDKVKYIYYGDWDYDKTPTFYEFPFMTMKHKKWLESHKK